MQARLLKPLDDRPAPDRDHAKGGFSLAALEDLVRDCQGQPDWRPRADLAHAYYDMGKQISAEKAHKIRTDWQIDPRQTNLIHGVINGVLGQEARTRSDVRVEADDDEHADMSDVFSLRMKEAQREANVDMAVSNSYAGQVKGGIGWVEVSRSSDPLDYPYRVQEVHRNEIWFDWRSKHLGLNDARWLVRKRWQDLDEAIALMPEHADVLRYCINGWDMVALPDEETSLLGAAYAAERRSTIRRDEWADSTRKRIKLFEVWYRVPAEVVVLHLSPTRRVQYDEANPLHQQAVVRGLVKVSKAVTRQIRMALFAGPHRLMDVGTTRRSFPYVPFFAFRDDEDRSPYGLIEGMISPQDEYNERRQMIQWMLKAKQVYIDRDALDTDYNNIHDAARMAMRPDATFVLNPNRKYAEGLRIKNDLSMQREQVDVMQDAKQLIQDVPRIYSTQLGDAPRGVTSGVAINSLTEAGAMAMGELNDNYRFARKMVHEQLLDLIIEDHLQEDMKVTLGSGQSKRTILLNSWDKETGAPINRVKDAPIKVGLADLPSSPAFRMQEQQQIADMIRALAGNPAAMNLLAPAYLENSSVPNAKNLANDLRRATGVPVAEDRQAVQQAQAQQQQMLAEQQALQKRMAAAQIEKADADADAQRAKAHETNTRAQLNVAQIAQISAQVNTPAEDELIEGVMNEAAQA